MTTNLYAHEFTWSGHGENVIATGSFDEWKSTLPLTRNNEGKLTATLPIPHGSKITFKYIVDGAWQHNPNEPFEDDGHGNINNVFQAPDAPIIVPVGEAQKPILPVPDAIATTDAAVVSPAIIKEPEQLVVEEKKVEEEPLSILSSATAGVAAAVTGAVGLAGAAITSVAGSSPLTLVSSQDEAITKQEVPHEPIPTPIIPTTTNTLASPPAPAAVDKAIVEEQKKEQGVGAPVLGAIVGGAAAVGAGAAAVATKASDSAATGINKAAESTTFQQAEVKAHELAVQADHLKDQAIAEANKAYAEGEKLAAEAYEKVAATSFGASVMGALGLDHKAAETKEASPAALAASAAPADFVAPQPIVPAASVAPVIPISEVAPTPAPSEPLPSAPKQPIVPEAAVAPSIPLSQAASSPAPAVAEPVVPAASVAPVIPVAQATPTSTPTPSAPSTPAKDLKSKVAEGLGHGDAPGSPAGSSSKRKSSFFKKLFHKSDSPKK